MIEVTDLSGRKHMLALANIARVSEPGDASAWHGVRAFVRLFDGTTIEARESPAEIARSVEKQAKVCANCGGEHQR